ncbi:hypothetical protein FJZ31_14050 [Candidatus Poribacteria bacterium]|nr:hypothetical protein [Candidatus Poribacteria bacterium]
MSKTKIKNQLPPNIQELLQKKGWTWPPDEQLRAEIHEAWERLIGSRSTDPEVLKEVHYAKD